MEICSLSSVIFKVTFPEACLFLRPSEKEGASSLLNARSASIIVVLPALFAPVIIVRPLPIVLSSGIENSISISYPNPRNPLISSFLIVIDLLWKNH